MSGANELLAEVAGIGRESGGGYTRLSWDAATMELREWFAGQADALGLDYWKAMRLVIMPQALKISIPGIVSTFIGMFKDTTLVVFVGLMILIGCIYVMTLFTGRTKTKKVAAKPEITEIEPIRAVQAEPAEEENNQQVIAAITAAIAAVWQSDTGFVVRHVRRVHNAPAWNRAGREDQVYSRM